MSEDVRLEEVNQTDSPSENTSQESTPEDWQNLDGRSQDRFKKIVAIKNEALAEKQRLADEVERLRRQTASSYQPVPMPQTPVQMTEDQRIAADFLKNQAGFLTKDQLEAEKEKIRQEFQAQRDREYLDTTHEKLENKFAKAGYPTYDRQEIEDRMRETGVFDPEYHYEKLYRDEILKVEANKHSKPSGQTYSERTRSRISGSQPWTPETLAERLRQPDGKEFYMKNAEKIDALNRQWMQGG